MTISIRSAHAGQVHGGREAVFREVMPQIVDAEERKPNGDRRLTGRVNNVIMASGHRVGIGEAKAARASHSAVAEGSVMGMPHCIGRQSNYAFATLDVDEIVMLGAIRSALSLPKTRSEKIMRRNMPEATWKTWATLPLSPIRPWSPTSPRTRASRLLEAGRLRHAATMRLC